MKDLETIIEETNATMRMEGMPLTIDDKNRIRKCIENPKLLEEIIKNLVKKYNHY